MEQSDKVAVKVAVMVDDMFFAAKINGAAQAAGRIVERIRSREQLETDVAQNPPSLLLVDLNSDRVDPLEAIRFFKSREQLKAVPVVAFVSHVQTDLIRSAQDAGCDYVLPRSAFTALLNEIVAGNLSALKK
jgi:DNA-binding NarL/FixJ family response regulator